jgi:hypothetical protein
VTTDKVGTLVPSVHQINHLELLTMSIDLNAELNAFRAMIVTLTDDIIRQRDAVSISSINTGGREEKLATKCVYLVQRTMYGAAWLVQQWSVQQWSVQ